MSTLHLRHRRMLSARRRLGTQLPHDVLAGRAQRHAQGWRDQLDAQDQLNAARGIVWAGLVGTLCWAVIVGVLLFITGCGSADAPAKPAQCVCVRPGPGVNAFQTFQCECGSEAHRLYGR